MEQTPEDCVALKLGLMKQSLKEANVLDPEVEKLIDHEIELQGIRSHSEVNQLGAQDAISEHGPMDLHKLKQAKDMHDSKLASAEKMASMKNQNGVNPQ